MKAREILLALVIIAVGVVGHLVTSGKLDFMFGREGFLLLAGEEYLFEETLEIPGPVPDRLEIRNSHGGVDVRTGPADRLSVAFRKRVYARTKGRAEVVADKLKALVDRDGGRLVLKTNREDFKRPSFETEFTVTVPPGLPVKVTNSYGPVKIAGTSAAEIDNPHGAVRAEDVGGPLVLANSYEDVVVRNAAADVRCACPHSELTIENVRGGVVIEHRYGGITLRDIAGAVDIRGQHSRISGTRLPGGVKAESSYDDVLLTETGPLTIRGPHCEIDIRTADGSVDITGLYGRIDVRGVRGDLSIDAPKSEIRAEDIAAGEIVLSSSYENVELARFSGSAKIRLEHGDLTLEPLDLSGGIDVEASSSGILLAWPEGRRVPIEAASLGGRVIWNLPDRPDVEESNGRSLVKAYQGGGGGRSVVRLSTTHGDIRIEGKGTERNTF